MPRKPKTYVQHGPDDFPHFELPPTERTFENDAQWESLLEGRRRHCYSLSIYLQAIQYQLTDRGTHKTCRIGRCRRLRHCLGRRDMFDWSNAIAPLLPPCVPATWEVFEPLRDNVRRALQLWPPEAAAGRGEVRLQRYRLPLEGRLKRQA